MAAPRPPALVYAAVFALIVVSAAIVGAVVGYSLPDDFSTANDKFNLALTCTWQSAAWAAVLGGGLLAALGAGYGVASLRGTSLTDAAAAVA